MWLKIASLATLIVLIHGHCDPSCTLEKQNVPGYFFDFGTEVGDTLMEEGYGTNYAHLSGLPDYKYRGTRYNDIVISVNGHVVFGDTPYPWWDPWWLGGTDTKYTTDLMAVFWSFTNNKYRHSEVYYRRSTTAGDLNELKELVNEVGGTGDGMAEAIVITWFNVGQGFYVCPNRKRRAADVVRALSAPSDDVVADNEILVERADSESHMGQNTYQMVIGRTSNSKTFVVFNYAKICWTYHGYCMIGFNQKDFGARYAFKGSFSETGCGDVMDYGNPVDGQYVFRVDPKTSAPVGTAPNCKNPFGWFIMDYDRSKTDFEYQVCKGD